MKRSWMGAGLLLLLLAGGVLSTAWVRQTHEQMALHAHAAADFALREDWDSAAVQTGRVWEQWERHRRLSASLANHAPLEQIELLFAQLEIYAVAEESVAYASLCTQLGTELQALADAQRFNWWNLL